jgi:hypothetical protein
VTQIIIDVGYKSKVMGLYGSWGQQLLRHAGQIGGPVLSWIEGHRIGNTIDLSLDAAFLPSLRASGVPFKEI